MPAPADEIPLLVRAGAVLPLLPADVDTLTGFGPAPGVVPLRDRADSLQLLAFPRGVSSAALGEAGRVTSTERPDGWRVELTGPVRTFALQAALSTLEQPLVPCRVLLDGADVPGWTYDAGTQVLRATVRTGTLEVTGCASAAAPSVAPVARGALPGTGGPALLGVIGLLALLGAATALRGVAGRERLRA